MNNDGLPQQGQITLDQTTGIKCDECGNQYFESVTIWRKVSSLMSPTGKETMVDIPVFACFKCKHINKVFVPIELHGELFADE